MTSIIYPFETVVSKPGGIHVIINQGFFSDRNAVRLLNGRHTYKNKLLKGYIAFINYVIIVIHFSYLPFQKK